MDNIENQAKTEIQELLTELVVTPVSEAFTSKLTEISETYTSIKNILGQIDSINGLITRVKDEVGGKIGDVSESTGVIIKTIRGIRPLEEHVNKMKSILEEGKSEINKIQAIVNSLAEVKGQVDSVRNVVSDTKDTINTIKEQIESFSTQLNEMKSILEEEKVEINKIQIIANNIGEVKGQINSVQTDVSDTKGTINSIKEQIESFSKQLNESKSILEEEKVEISKIQENANVLGQVKNQLDLMRNNNKYIHFFMVCIFLLNVGIMIWLLFR